MELARYLQAGLFVFAKSLFSFLIAKFIAVYKYSRTMRNIKIMRGILIFLVVLLAAACSTLPTGKEGPEAEALADKMIESAGYEKWKTDTSAVIFDFREKETIFYDLKRNLIEVGLADGNEIIQLNRATWKAIVKIKGKKLEGGKKFDEMVATANAKFVNNIFWLNPLYHIRSPGAKRYLVDKNRLRVTFSSGGVTPGDSYVFTFDEKQNRMVKIEMWVSIIPIKGISATFENYKTFETGVPVAQDHKNGFLNIKLRKIKFWGEYPGTETDRFAELVAP
jgi:hypothetical protein